MKSKVCLWTISVLLIAFSLFMQAQEASPMRLGIPAFCSSQPSGPTRMMVPFCNKRAQAAQPRLLYHNGLRDDNQGGTLRTFQIPSDIAYPSSINNAGTVVGTTAGGHGFLRTRDATITEFDAPGAVSTQAPAINSAGTAAGIACDQTFTCHGFVRDSRGAFTSFDVPGACDTGAWGINPSGTVTGFWLESDCATLHAFVRSPEGQITTFDVPGDENTNYTFLYPMPNIIDPTGTITGFYFDTQENRTRGYVRDRDGMLTVFDGPCQTCGTSVSGIDAAGVITGNNGSGGYLRYPDGTFSTVEFPEASGTGVTAIAPDGAIAGLAVVDGDFTPFLRNPGGQYTTFTLPGGTVPGTNAAVNSAGAITGVYLDFNQQNPWVAYVWIPN